MPKILQINVVSNILSTGKISEDISKVAMSYGWECYIAYGRESHPSVNVEIQIGSKLDVYKHYAFSLLFDREGWESVRATRSLICKIKDLAPDIIQLHNIHDHYLNYPILFKYLASCDIPIVWVQHDCWTFTGGCMFFDRIGCEKWTTVCEQCPEKRAFFFDNSKKHFLLKQRLLNEIKTLIYVPVSFWLEGLIKKSHQGHRRVKTIHNGVDLGLFRPTIKTRIDRTFKILGVAAVWSARKGLDDFIKLRRILPQEYEITLVGLSQQQIERLPTGINGIERTANIQEMVQLYNDSDVFVNPTYSDNFPTTNIESLACGTPVITYNTGGSPEAIDENTGVVIPQGNVDALARAIMQMKIYPLSSVDCRSRAEQYFDKDKCFLQYISLYEELLSR